jgi:photosystem II stability/assembly factor-like uncharacterized protein
MKKSYALLMVLAFSTTIFCSFGWAQTFIWTERQPAGAVDYTWSCAASSSDGNKLLAGANGRLYVSTDGGINWTETQPAGSVDKYWSRAASSSDGNKLVVSVCSGRLYTSTDAGSTWTERQPAGDVNRCWWCLASSSDGNSLIVGASPGRLFTSTDAGTSWTERQPEGNLDKSWSCAASSSDGNVLIAGIDAGRLYTCTDAGATWIERQPAGDVDMHWWSVASSADGSKLIAGGDSGKVYVSTDTGATWTAHQPAGSVNSYWGYAVSSSNGNKIIAGLWCGNPYFSTDGGATWTETRPDPVVNNWCWKCLAGSSDGTRVLVGAYGRRLYTGSLVLAPTVTTATITSIASTIASGGGNVTSDGGDSVTSRGVCWSTSENPTVADSHSVDGAGTGAFTSSLTNLIPNTPYYVRAYAINSVDTGYGDQETFTTLQTFTVSGHVTLSTKSADGIDSVLMDGLPGDPLTDSTGYYTATVDSGWSGVVRPTKVGYTFNPDSIVFNNVSENQNASYSGVLLSYTISGHVWTSDSTGIDSVTLSGLPGDPLTDTSGYYTATVDYGWSGVVTPTKDGYTFAPESTSYNDVTDNQETDYTGTLLTYTISGFVHRSLKTGVNPGIKDVTMSGLPGNPLTDSTGYYIALVDYGWSGVVTPEKSCYVIVPESTTYSNVTENQVTSYTGALITYTVSGHVWTSDSTGIDSVTMSGFPGVPSTDSTGYYTATVNCGWTGVVTPTRLGYTFAPESTSYSSVTDDQETDYFGTYLTYTISGYVHNTDSVGVEGVVLSGLPGDPETDTGGYYSATVPYGWSGRVTPTDTCVFDPEYRDYDSVTSDQTYQSYVEDCFSQGVDDGKENLLPKEYQLAQNHPNPFNPETEIVFGLPKASLVTLKIYNILGQEVTTLVEKNMPAGEYRIVWNGTDRSGRAVSSGVYFYRMQAGDFVQTKRMLLIK